MSNGVNEIVSLVQNVKRAVKELRSARDHRSNDLLLAYKHLTRFMVDELAEIKKLRRDEIEDLTKTFEVLNESPATKDLKSMRAEAENKIWRLYNAKIEEEDGEISFTLPGDFKTDTDGYFYEGDASNVELDEFSRLVKEAE